MYISLSRITQIRISYITIAILHLESYTLAHQEFAVSGYFFKNFLLLVWAFGFLPFSVLVMLKKVVQASYATDVTEAIRKYLSLLED